MLNIVMALAAEARPLIEALSLRREHEDRAFPVYTGSDTRLIVSGIGRAHAAAATSWLQGSYGQSRDLAWLNVGIAGHARLPIGSGCLIHCIDDGHGRRSYPPRPFAWHGMSEGTLCLDHPASDYPGDGLVDMESAGFHATACRLSQSEFVQCYKIVSDNRSRPIAGRPDAKMVSGLIEARLDEIIELGQRLREMSRDWRRITAPPARLDEILALAHFTFNQRRQLEERLRCLELHGIPLPRELAGKDRARAILGCLDEAIRQALEY